MHATVSDAEINIVLRSKLGRATRALSKTTEGFRVRLLDSLIGRRDVNDEGLQRAVIRWLGRSMGGR